MLTGLCHSDVGPLQISWFSSESTNYIPLSGEKGGGSEHIIIMEAGGDGLEEDFFLEEMLCGNNLRPFSHTVGCTL